MDTFLSNPSHIWLIVGVAVIVFEFFITPGLGVVFAGIGALTTGALLEAGVIESSLEQWFVFLVSTAIWAALLWKPLKSMIAGKGKGSNQSHIIGTEAVAAKSGVTKTAGTAKWSGTEMAAKLAHDSEITELKAGELAEVVALEGSTLILKPKQN